MPFPYTIVDAFTAVPFAGNPAAVYILDAPRTDSWMQRVAREMNLSETAFLLPEGAGYRLRWFTPAAVEIKLCGHATLGSAHVLWETGRLAHNDATHFFTLSGELIAARDGEWITLDFPQNAPAPCDLPDGLEAARGVRVLGAYGNVAEKLLVEVADATTVRSINPDITALKRLPVRGTIVTAPGDEPGIDFVSRYFAPAVGVNEDPVTGSAHTVLAPFWMDRFAKVPGTTLVGHQLSPRGGIVRVALRDDRVLLGGQAVTVARGELLVA
jgi:PhzF family phenazine biosynthesis protein